MMSTKPISTSISGTKTRLDSKSKRVFVGLSGGVDSAVSAALLKERGFDVTGVFIKAWQPEWIECTWREERRDAMRVCLALDIPFLFLDMESEYKAGVVDKMLAEYKANRTPNPDVLCNREIKFGKFWEEAKKRGADFIATGHYALSEGGELKEGNDKDKDQSYFLWTLTEDDLAHTIFPVGDLAKPAVRELAKKYKLPVAEKKDSQGICFMGEVEMEEFLSHYITTKPGRVFDTQGKVIGRHKGLVYYTIGERRGFEITEKSPDSGPFYVVDKDIKTNSILVSDDESDIVLHSPQEIAIKDVNWISEPESESLTARVRYRGEKLNCTLELKGNPSTPLRAGKLSVKFEKSVRGLSLGQSVVFYNGELCLGGAVMDKIIS